VLPQLVAAQASQQGESVAQEVLLAQRHQLREGREVVPEDAELHLIQVQLVLVASLYYWRLQQKAVLHQKAIFPSLFAHGMSPDSSCEIFAF